MANLPQLAVEEQQPASMSRQDLHVDMAFRAWEHMMHNLMHTIETLTNGMLLRMGMGAFLL